MPRTIVLLALIVASQVAAQPTVIQGPKCTGIIHGIVYDLSGQRAVGVRVIAFPVGVQLGALLPTTNADHDGLYRFDHVCHGKYTVMADDPQAGYPSTFPDQNEFLYGTQTRTVRLNLWHRRAELPVHLPPKPGRVLLHVRHSQMDSEIHKFSVRFKVPGQRRSPEESMDFDNNDQYEIPVPSGKSVLVLVRAEGYKEIAKSIFVDSGTLAVLDLSIEQIN